MDYKEYLQMSGNTIEVKESNNTINPKGFLENLKAIKNGNYGQNLLSKSKFTVRGSLIGGALGIGVAMYYKKSLLFGALIGIVSGTILAHIVSELKFQSNISKNKTNEKS
jgi:hypothetical protein